MKLELYLFTCKKDLVGSTEMLHLASILSKHTHVGNSHFFFFIFTVFKYVGSTFVERCKLIFDLIPPETLGFNFHMSRRQRLVPKIL